MPDVFAFARDIDLVLPDGCFERSSNRIFPAPGSVMDLAFLQDALKPEGGSGGEFFLPRRLYVREEMETAAREIRNNGSDSRTVLSGSPGIGKSIVCFLITLYSVWKDDIKAVYLRDVADNDELMSVFAMSRNENSSINIRYSRELGFIDRLQVYFQLRGSFHGISKISREIFAVLDGPRTDTYQPYKRLTIGCTSGGGLRVTDEMRSTYNVVMGAWRKETLRLAVSALVGLDATIDDEQNKLYFDEDKFEKVYFVRGGRIRKFCEYYLGTVDTTLADETISRVSKQQASLSLSLSDCRSTSDHIDTLRSIFRADGGGTHSVNMHVDSQYMIRGLQQKIDGEELFNSYKRAERQKNTGAQANYFEELMHWCFCQDNMSPSIVGSVHSTGTGAEGVSQLTATNVYWIPSISNFANIDSAIVGSRGDLWCFQFTIGTVHTYKSRRFQQQFLRNIPVPVNGPATILFVVPRGTAFAEPNVNGDASTRTVSVDCSSLQSIRQAATAMISGVAPPPPPEV